MGRTENLKKWKSGESGNPTGKPGPKKHHFNSVTDALRRIGREIEVNIAGEQQDFKVTFKPKRRPMDAYEAAAWDLWWHGISGFNGKGSPKVIAKIQERLEGKVPDIQVQITEQKTPQEHVQNALSILERLKKNEDSGDTRVN